MKTRIYAAPAVKGLNKHRVFKICISWLLKIKLNSKQHYHYNVYGDIYVTRTKTGDKIATIYVYMLFYMVAKKTFWKAKQT